MTTSTLLNPFIRNRFTWLAYFMLAYYAYLQATLGPLMPFLRAELNLNYTVGGLHLSAFALGMILAGLTGDRLAQAWGRRFVLWAGSIGMAVGALGLAWSSQAIMTIASTLFMGFLGSFVLVMVQATLSDQHKEQRTIALTEANIAASLSASMVPVLISGFQRTPIGWRGTLFLAVVILILLMAHFQKEPVPDIRSNRTELRSSPQALPIFYWAYWLVLFMGVSVEWCLIFWSPEYLESVVGLTKVNAAAMISLFFLSMVLGRIVVSRLTRIFPGTTLLLLAMGITMVGFPIFWLAPFAPLNVIGLCIAGFGVANLFPLSLSVAVGTAPEQANAASARISLGTGLAIFIAPLVLGWTADHFGLQDAYSMVPLLLFVAVLLTFLTNRLAKNNLKNSG